MKTSLLLTAAAALQIASAQYDDEQPRQLRGERGLVDAPASASAKAGKSGSAKADKVAGDAKAEKYSKAAKPFKSKAAKSAKSKSAKDSSASGSGSGGAKSAKILGKSAKSADGSSAKAEKEAPFAKSSKSTKSSKSKINDRVNELEDEFPILGSLVIQTVVDQYVEKDNTSIRIQGLVAEVIGEVTGCSGQDDLQTEYSQGVTKSEMVQLCVTKCEEVLEDCTIFRMEEATNADDEISFSCQFHNENSIAAQFPVENPVSSDTNLTEAAFYRYSVFHKGDELPEFQGCDVPVGDAAAGAALCTVARYLKDNGFYGGEWTGAISEAVCTPILDSLSSDFEDYILPSLQCTLEAQMEGKADLANCLQCLINAGATCHSGSICDEDNTVTKTCGDYCPSSTEYPDCVSKTQTALLCQAGAKPVFNSQMQLGSCLNADVPGFPEQYLADKGNGDYKCLN